MPSVLFVCTANICRSPMAMALLQERVGDSPEWTIESAGTWSIQGQPAASNTQKVLAQRGIDIHNHRSRSVDRDLLRQFNLILTMEAGHKEALQVEFPEIAQRVYVLSEMIGESYNIHDPIGESIENFELTSEEFEQIFDIGFQKIADLAST